MSSIAWGCRSETPHVLVPRLDLWQTNTCFRRHPHPRPVPERALGNLGAAVQVRIGVFDHKFILPWLPRPPLRSLET